MVRVEIILIDARIESRGRRLKNADRQGILHDSSRLSRPCLTCPSRVSTDGASSPQRRAICPEHHSAFGEFFCSLRAALCAELAQQVVLVRDEPHRCAAIGLAHERAKRFAAREPAVDITDHAESDPVVDEFLQHRAGEATVEPVEIVVQRVGGDRDPVGFMLVRERDEVERIAFALDETGGRIADQHTVAGCLDDSVVHAGWLRRHEKCEHGVALPADEVVLIRKKPDLRVRHETRQAIACIARIEHDVAAADDRQHRRGQSAQRAVAEHRDRFEARPKAAIHGAHERECVALGRRRRGRQTAEHAPSYARAPGIAEQQQR